MTCTKVPNGRVEAKALNRGCLSSSYPNESHRIRDFALQLAANCHQCCEHNDANQKGFRIRGVVICPPMNDLIGEERFNETHELRYEWYRRVKLVRDDAIVKNPERGQVKGCRKRQK